MDKATNQTIIEQDNIVSELRNESSTPTTGGDKYAVEQGGDNAAEADETPQLSMWLKVIFGIGIVGNVIRMTTNTFIMLMAGETALAVYNVLMHVTAIVLLTFVLRMKRWAVMGVFILQVVNAFCIAALSSGSFIVNFGFQLFNGLIIAGCFAALLCIRNDGVSAWKAIFGNKGDGGQEGDVQTGK